MGGSKEQDQSPLLQHSHSSDDHESQLITHRTGTIWTAIAHIITGVMGAGVLSLGWSLAQLGWLFGPPAIVVFALVTGVSTSILSDCYRSPHSEHGPDRHASFLQAVRFYLAIGAYQVLGVLGALSFWPLAIYFPVEMYLVQKKIAPWTRKWVALRTFSIACFLVSAFAFVGSLEGLVSAKLA